MTSMSFGIKCRPKLLWHHRNSLMLTALGTFVVAKFDFFRDAFWAIWAAMMEFEPYIGREAGKDCSMIMWTSERQYSVFHLGRNFDAKTLLENTSFNISHPVKLFLHGFSDTPRTRWIRTIKSSYFQVGNFNMFSVDWTPMVNPPWYSIAAANSKSVGRYAAMWLIKLNELGVAWEDMHVLGSSLGGHTAGATGRFTGGKVGRITGLDPSGPLFHMETSEDKLDPSDAQFVEVVHTAGKWVGNDDKMGHVDWFANEGRAPQPGCQGESIDLLCSHFRAWTIFSYAVVNNDHREFVGIQCPNYKDFKAGKCCKQTSAIPLILKLGEPANFSARGNYFFLTNNQYPFAKETVAESTNCSRFSTYRTIDIFFSSDN